MSPQEATVLAAIVGGILAGIFAIAGVLAGLFAERFLRSRGEVSCDTGPVRWTFRYHMTTEPPKQWTRTMNGLGKIGMGDVVQARSVEYRFRADFYNGRDLASGLRAFEVLFHRPDDDPMVHQDPEDMREPETEALKVVNLPPKQLVSVEVGGKVPDPMRLEGCDRVELRALFADRSGFSREVAWLDPAVVLVDLAD